MDIPTEHTTFTIEREFATPIARVFEAFADGDTKSRWFRGPPGSETLVRELDFRVGGRERVTTRFSDGIVHGFDAFYLDIATDSRIVYAYSMDLNGERISASLATLELRAQGSTTHMRFTEQAAFVNGFQDRGSRRQGSVYLFDSLAAALAH